jgi:hypothetical protein
MKKQTVNASSESINKQVTDRNGPGIWGTLRGSTPSPTKQQPSPSSSLPAKVYTVPPTPVTHEGTDSSDHHGRHTWSSLSLMALCSFVVRYMLHAFTELRKDSG